MRLPLCPGNQGSLDALLRLPQHHGCPAGPILMGLVALPMLCAAPFGLRMSPGIGDAGISDTRAQRATWHGAGRRECVAIPVHLHPNPCVADFPSLFPILTS